MRICRYLRIDGRDKTCEAGVEPVQCLGCQSFQLRMPYDPPTYVFPSTSTGAHGTKVAYSNPTLAEETAAKLRVKSSVVGGCGCHKR